MYCGSCTRDNSLARALMAGGHDVTLIPVYTPTRPDEPNVSRNRVLFGGISVYLQQYVRFFRSTPYVLDRLWDSPAVIRAFAGRAISTDPRLLGDLTISMLKGEQGVLRKEFDKLVEWTRAEPSPDVVDLPNSLLIAMAAPLKRALKSPICCTLQGEELFLESLVPPYREHALQLIREQVSVVDRFLAVSDYAADFMASYLRIPRGKISVVPLGISMEGYPDKPQRESQSRVFTVGYFARVAPEKGLHVLADAYGQLRERTREMPMRLLAAGHLAKSNQAYLNEVRGMLRRKGLEQEFDYRGEVDRNGKLAFLRELDVLSVPATYDEPKGMFLLEAMASGVPVVQPRRGAFTEIVQRTGGGLLATPDDPSSIAESLERLLRDQGLRQRLATEGYDGVRAHYSVNESVARLMSAYENVVSSRSRTPAPASGRHA